MAFVRVKRRLDEEPVEALLLAFKKRKISNCVTPSGVISQKVENVLQFCGTLGDKEEDVFEIARNYRESCQRAKKDIKTRDPLAEVAKQVKKERKESMKMGRYKLVCHQREMPLDEESKQTQGSHSTATNSAAIARHPSQSKLQIYDLVNDSEEVLETVKEETIAVNGVPLVKEPNPQQFNYVYDLYYSDAWNVDDGLIDNILSVQPYTQELYYGDYRDEEIADDDEDSNDENCYKNDYPSDEEYYREDDGDDYGLGEAVKPWNLDDSEEDEDGLVYTRKASPVYGSYDAYKRRMKREEEGESEDSDYD